MTKHWRALPCIDPTKARVWHALVVLKQTRQFLSPQHRNFGAFAHRVTALKMAQLRNTASPHDPLLLVDVKLANTCFHHSLLIYS